MFVTMIFPKSHASNCMTKSRLGLQILIESLLNSKTIGMLCWSLDIDKFKYQESKIGKDLESFAKCFGSFLQT